MLAIFIKTLPFFAIIALGYGAGRSRFFTEEAAAYLTRFIFYFALSAMIFRFAANLSLAEIWDSQLVLAYFTGSMAVYLLACAIGMLRRIGIEQIAVEAQCAVIGNTGFLGVPMFVLLFGEAAIGPLMLVLAVDLIVFSALIVILITGAREGRMSLAVLRPVGAGLIRNPMIVSMVLGLGWAALGTPLPGPVNEFVVILGGAATPGALFAIGASLASKSAERATVAGYLSFCKLVLHPAAVALAALLLFPVAPFAATIAVSAAALPVAGNVYMLAQHYGVAPQRVSAAILFSTAASIVTLPYVIAWISGP